MQRGKKQRNLSLYVFDSIINTYEKCFNKKEAYKNSLDDSVLVSFYTLNILTSYFVS